MANVSTRLPDELYQKVKQYADEHYIDVTTVIKLALAQFFSNESDK